MAPKGHSTRPTADRARQALFDVLEHAPWRRPLAEARVLDLFAGSGALGLEALSRGAARCVFVDSDRAAREAIARNLASLGLTDQGQVLAGDAARTLARGPFDLVFADPPYGLSLAGPALAAVVGELAEQAIVVVEESAEAPPAAPPGFDLLDARRWGAARVSFLRMRSPDRISAGS